MKWYNRSILHLIFMEELYKLQEEQTVGWVDIEGPFSKEECKRHYEAHLNEGTSPKRLKVVRVS